MTPSPYLPASSGITLLAEFVELPKSGLQPGDCVAVEQFHTRPGGSPTRGRQQRPWLRQL